MFKKVLVANRGEIAVRVIRALHELGIEAVAVYSEPDADSMHVHKADEAYLLGPAPSRESYLNIPRIIEVAQKAHVDAIHPGYGFLSENPDFATVCQAFGFVFIGPDPQSIAAMGLKQEARVTMLRAGVPVVPGSEGAVESEAEALRVADAIGYPVLLKAAAGGGGRGIRIARQPDDLRRAWDQARSEAESTFGRADVYVEKYLVEPRHVEFQILADRHGHVVHLGERDSSIQRRRQKLLEETPSTALDDALRARMAAAAIAAAKAVNYVNAGTVEFLVDEDRNFYFIEMNTRIQVEHTITEMVTGIDLVQQQIRIAAGEPLGFGQEDVQPRGVAMECRINAEDPTTLLPSPGVILAYQPPSGPGIRVDDCAHAGFAVTPYYDSMIAKLVAWAPTRPEVLARMRRALDEYWIEGIKTTIPVHQRLLTDARFQAGDYHTEFLEEMLRGS